MATDEKKGGKARDAKPDEKENDLARKRAEREGKKADPVAGNGKSIDDRAAEEITEDEDGQLAIGTIEGERITLGKLIKGGLPVKVQRSLMSASVPGKDGLLPPDGKTLLVVEVEVADYQPIPERERKQGEAKVTGWTIREHLRVVQAARAESADGRAMLGLPMASGE